MLKNFWWTGATLKRMLIEPMMMLAQLLMLVIVIQVEIMSEQRAWRNCFRDWPHHPLPGSSKPRACNWENHAESTSHCTASSLYWTRERWLCEQPTRRSVISRRRRCKSQLSYTRFALFACVPQFSPLFTLLSMTCFLSSDTEHYSGWWELFNFIFAK